MNFPLKRKKYPPPPGPLPPCGVAHRVCPTEPPAPFWGCGRGSGHTRPLARPPGPPHIAPRTKFLKKIFKIFVRRAGNQPLVGWLLGRS